MTQSHLNSPVVEGQLQSMNAHINQLARWLPHLLKSNKPSFLVHMIFATGKKDKVQKFSLQDKIKVFSNPSRLWFQELLFHPARMALVTFQVATYPQGNQPALPNSVTKTRKI